MNFSNLRKAKLGRAHPGRDDGVHWLPASRVRPTAGGDRLVLSLCIATAVVLAMAGGFAAWGRRGDGPPAVIRSPSPSKAAEPISAPDSRRPVQAPSPSPASLLSPFPLAPASLAPASLAPRPVIEAVDWALPDSSDVAAAPASPEPPPLEALAPPSAVVAPSQSSAGDAPRAPPEKPAPRPAVAPGARVAVYLDQYPDQRSAAAALKTAQAKVGPYIGANRLTYTRRNNADWRLRVGNLAPAAAEAICAKVKAAGQTCAVGPN